MRKSQKATIARIAVAADADPRTVAKALEGKSVRGQTAVRIHRALKKAGLLPKAEAAQ